PKGTGRSAGYVRGRIPVSAFRVTVPAIVVAVGAAVPRRSRGAISLHRAASSSDSRSYPRTRVDGFRRHSPRGKARRRPRIQGDTPRRSNLALRRRTMEGVGEGSGIASRLLWSGIGHGEGGAPQPTDGHLVEIRDGHERDRRLARAS